MYDLAMFDIFLRGSAFTVLLHVALIFLVGGALNRKRFSVILLCVSLGPYLLVSSPSINLSWVSVHSLLVMIAGIIPVLVYWATLELFNDDVVLQPWQLLLAAIIISTAWLSPLLPSLGLVRGICVFAFFIHALWIVVSTDADDLIASRRRFRRSFLVWILGIGIIITFFESAQLDQGLPIWVFLAQAMAILLSASAFLLWSVQTRSDIWTAKSRKPTQSVSASPAQLALIQRIESAMTAGLWRKEGLSVPQVAIALKTQEHRVRAAINQGMGHRNFTSYVNGFRIQEAKRMLKATEMAESSVLSIAYDVGFSSLGPFNRAFKAETGMTPTEFRKNTLNLNDC